MKEKKKKKKTLESSGTPRRTTSFNRLGKRQLEIWAGEVSSEDLAAVETARPRTRGDCASVSRPCPFVGCRHNLYLDVNESTGSFTIRFPDLAPDQVPPERSCSLDVADLGAATLDDVGRLLNVTRERARQVEAMAYARLKRSSVLRAHVDDPDDPDLVRAPPEASSSFGGACRSRSALETAAEDASADEESLSPAVAEPGSDEDQESFAGLDASGNLAAAFRGESDRPELRASAIVWRIYTRNHAGFEGQPVPRSPKRRKSGANRAGSCLATPTELELGSSTETTETTIETTAWEAVMTAALDAAIEQEEQESAMAKKTTAITDRQQAVLGMLEGANPPTYAQIAAHLGTNMAAVARDAALLKKKKKKKLLPGGRVGGRKGGRRKKGELSTPSNGASASPNGGAPAGAGSVATSAAVAALKKELVELETGAATVKRAIAVLETRS